MYSENGANDNPRIESLWARLTTEIESKLIGAGTLDELREVIDEHFEYYNHDRRHSSIGQTPPHEHLNSLSNDGKIATLC